MISSLNELFENVTTQTRTEKLLSSSPLLEKYCGDDWKKYLCESEGVHLETCKKTENYEKKPIYHKVIVCANDIIEMFIIKWDRFSESCIHDHPEFGCIVKMLAGKLREDVYETTDYGIKFCSTNILNKNDIGYKESNKIIHKITNIHDDYSVSLHIYSKPNYKHNSYVL
jgi:cysteine dioxygenase